MSQPVADNPMYSVTKPLLSPGPRSIRGAPGCGMVQCIVIIMFMPSQQDAA